MFATLGCLFLTAVHVFHEISFDSVSFLFFVDIWMIEVGLFYRWIAGLLERWDGGVDHCLGKKKENSFT